MFFPSTVVGWQIAEKLVLMRVRPPGGENEAAAIDFAPLTGTATPTTTISTSIISQYLKRSPSPERERVGERERVSE